MLERPEYATCSSPCRVAVQMHIILDILSLVFLKERQIIKITYPFKELFLHLRIINSRCSRPLLRLHARNECYYLYRDTRKDVRTVANRARSLNNHNEFRARAEIALFRA